MHYVFNTPEDRLVWDVGHQTYPHKILTGRRERMRTLRQKDGLAGFARRDESEYDTFGAGHSSTSVSAALGMAVAAARTASERKVVAVIGDGALSAGMAFEALNNAGSQDADILVVLNDNDMSISPNVGAMSNYLTRILSGKVFTSVREGSKTVLSTVPPMWKFAKRWEEHVKGMIMPSTLFEEMGFNYYGPIDGHDLPTLVRTLRNLRGQKGARFLHVVTRKGKGYEPAEGDPCVYHGVTPFDPTTGKMEKKPSGKTYTQVFGEWLCDMAARDVRLIGITPAMREGSGLVEFSKRFENRYFDVGIAGNTRSPSPPASRPTACGRWWRFIRRSCSAPTTSSSTTFACKICRCCSPLTAPASSARTARHTTARSIFRTCAVCRTWW